MYNLALNHLPRELCRVFSSNILHSHIPLPPLDLYSPGMCSSSYFNYFNSQRFAHHHKHGDSLYSFPIFTPPPAQHRAIALRSYSHIFNFLCHWKIQNLVQAEISGERANVLLCRKFLESVLSSFSGKWLDCQIILFILEDYNFSSLILEPLSI